MKYIDVTRTTCTSLDVLLEKNMDDNWNVDGERELSKCVGQASQDSFYWTRGIWRVYMVRVETDEETNNLKTRQCMAICVEAHVWCSETQGEANMGYRETKVR